MLILSFTENGEVPTIFLVMTLFGEIQHDYVSYVVDHCVSLRYIEVIRSIVLSNVL